MVLRTNKIIMILFVSILCVGCDQMTKFATKNLMEPGSITSLLGDTIRLQLANNKGAFLSLGSSLSDEWRFWIFTVFVSITLLILLIYYLFSKSLSLLSSIALSLIISGGFSNLIDRILYKGIVIDFLNFGIGNLRTGIINIADITITSGVILIAYSALISNRNRSKLIKIYPNN